MALMIFVSSVGITVDLHYCKGQFKTFSLFGKAKSCHEIGQGIKTCPHHKAMTEKQQVAEKITEDKGCCSNKTLYLQADNDKNSQIADVLLNPVQLYHFAIAFVVAFQNTVALPTGILSNHHYKPPLIHRDICVFFETFLL